MRVINATSARAKLFELIDEAAEAHEPILVTSRRNNVVLICEEDWMDIEKELNFSWSSGDESLVSGNQDIDENRVNL
jgi:prevent-host-death family protein